MGPGAPSPPCSISGTRNRFSQNGRRDRAIWNALWWRPWHPDRLPGYRRNFFTGPNYITTDLRVARRFDLGDRFKLEMLVEAFNLMNRENPRVDLTDDGFLNTAGNSVLISKTIGFSHFPAHYQLSSGFLTPTNAYAPRQVQIAVRLTF